MALLDRVKQAVNGRSGAIEKAIDTVVRRVGTYSTSLADQAEGLKARVRDLDEGRAAGDAGTAAEPDPGPPGPVLRGDLAPPAPGDRPDPAS